MEPRQDFDLDSLPTLIPAIFDQAQSSAATHKKNCVALHKVQIASAKIVEGGKGVRQDSEVKLVGERAFGEVVLDLLNRVLVVKRSTPPADRIVKFIGSYVRFIFEKGMLTLCLHSQGFHGSKIAEKKNQQPHDSLCAY